MSYFTILRESLNSNLMRLEHELRDSDVVEPIHLLDTRPCSALDDPDRLPSQETVKLIEKIQIDIKAIEASITPTQTKLVQLANSHYTSAALGAAVTLDIAGTIISLGGEASLYDIARETQTNEHKLGRILRTLTGEFIFLETSLNVFRNTRHSIGLASAGARSFLSFITSIGMRCASEISNDMVNAETMDSFSESTAPFCKAVAEHGESFSQYMSDPNNTAMTRLGNEGIVGWLNKLTRSALLNDYPWAELGNATIIDIGAGMGDSGIDVMLQYPHLNWVYQDLEPVIEMLREENFPKELRSRVDCGDFRFVIQDYFQPNTSRGDVWYMRGVLHEYDDDKVLEILGHIKSAMKSTSHSRVIINEVLNSSPIIMPPSSNSAPSRHIPALQSRLAAMANNMTWSTYSLFGGKERSYLEYEVLLRKAGFKVSNLFTFRTFTVMIEAIVA